MKDELPKRWMMYVLKCADQSFYAGVTTDLERRLHEHNNTNRAAKYTRSRRPVKLLYYEPHANRSSAQIAESSFKKLSRKQKEEKLCLS
jgi:putative endonuclease